MVGTSLLKSIFQLVVGVLFITLIIMLINVWMATNNHARQQLERDLHVAQNVLREVMNNQERLLYNSADVLTADFGFKQAVATRENETINSVLYNHGQRIDASVMALMSLSGDLITSTAPSLFSEDKFNNNTLLDKVITEGGAVAIRMIDQHLYQFVMLTVDAPSPIAIALIGFEMDNALVSQLKSLTQLEITISVISEDRTVLFISTLPPINVDKVLANINNDISIANVFSFEDKQYVSRQFTIAQHENYNIVLTLSEDSSELLSGFVDLLINISVIASIAIIAAIPLAFTLSRRLAHPLIRLSNFSKALASGDYNQSLDVSSRMLEFNNLVTSFDIMQKNIRDREAEITYQAQHDELTGLFSRRHIEHLLEKMLKDSISIQIIGIDIFDFRTINDAWFRIISAIFMRRGQLV